MNTSVRAELTLLAGKHSDLGESGTSQADGTNDRLSHDCLPSICSRQRFVGPISSAACRSWSTG